MSMRFYETMIRMICKMTFSFLAIGPVEVWTRNGEDDIFKKQLERKQAMLCNTMVDHGETVNFGRGGGVTTHEHGSRLFRVFVTYGYDFWIESLLRTV